MKRKIMIEVSEEEYELIKSGKLEEKIQAITLENATIEQLLSEFITRTPDENRQYGSYYDKQRDKTIFHCQCTLKYWTEIPQANKLEERIIVISSGTTGKIKDKENE